MLNSSSSSSSSNLNYTANETSIASINGVNSGNYNSLRAVSNNFLSLLYVQTIVGVIGNILCLAVLFRKPFLGSTSTIYLRAVAIVDSLILFMMNFLMQRFFGRFVCFNKIPCYFSRYLYTVLNDISIWILVLFTAERLIIMLRPFNAKIWLTVRRSIVAITTTSLVLAVVDGHDVWFMGRNMCTRCMIFYREGDIIEDIISILNSTKKVFLPVTFMAISSVIIVVQLQRERMRVGRLNHSSQIRTTADRNSVKFTSTLDHCNSIDSEFQSDAVATIGCGGRGGVEQLEKSGKPIATTPRKTTKPRRRDKGTVIILIALNVCSIITRVPSEVHRLVTEGQSGPQVWLVRSILVGLVAMNQTINLFMYAGTGSRFRAQFVEMLMEVGIFFRNKCIR